MKLFDTATTTRASIPVSRLDVREAWLANTSAIATTIEIVAVVKITLPISAPEERPTGDRRLAANLLAGRILQLQFVVTKLRHAISH
jgi:hypothetical protein